MACAVGVAVTEDDGAGAVGVDVGGAVRENGFDGSAADVCDGGCGRGMDIHQAGHGCAVIGRHVGDDVGQGDMVGEGPVVGVARAIRVRIAIDDVSLTSVEGGAVDGDGPRREAVAAGVGNRRQGDAVGGDVGQAVDGGLAGIGGDGEVHRNNMVGVGPGVSGVVDRVGEGIDRVAASAVGVEGGAFKGERDHAVADRHGRGCRHEDVGGAMDGGVGVGHGVERHRRDGIDELPWIVATSAVSVGVLVDDGAVPVGGDIHGRVGGVCRGDDLAPAGIGERVGSGFDGIADAGHGGGTVLWNGQGRRRDDVGVGPVVVISCAVGKGVGVGHGALAAGHGGVDGREGVADLGAAVVDYGRDMRCRDNGIRQTADGVKAVWGGDAEVFRHDMVGVVPGVVGAVDIVSIDESGVAAAVAQSAGVGAEVQVNTLPAVGDVGQGGRVDLGEAVDGGVRIGGG